MSVSRNYTSPLREQQMAQTRELILERAVELLGDRTAGELTVAAAAEKAGVSTRTAYRYFPTKEALQDALNEWFMRRWGASPRYPERLDGLHEMVGKLYLSFADNESLIRASRHTTPGAETRARRKQLQARAIQKMIEAERVSLPAEVLRRFAVAIHSLLSADHYLNMRDTWSLTVEEATASTRWAIAVLIADIREGGA